MQRKKKYQTRYKENTITSVVPCAGVASAALPIAGQPEVTHVAQHRAVVEGAGGRVARRAGAQVVAAADVVRRLLPGPGLGLGGLGAAVARALALAAPFLGAAAVGPGRARLGLLRPLPRGKMAWGP